tara:strand:+ start:541 stop:1281 length:741 start_codon:yes stop_codon:yes gene_type:complete
VQIIPAIDLKNNKCVRLSKGKDKSSLVYNEDPVKQAIYFEQIGCKKLHLIDLDAAFGRPNVNFETIKKIRKSISIPIQLGGGIRNLDLANKYFEAEINNLIIGSMSVEKPDDVIILSNQHANKIYISLDILEDNIMIKGWDENSGKKIQDVFDVYNSSKIKGYIITDIKNDGMLKGLDLDFINNFLKKINLIEKFSKKIIIAGGLTNYSDLMNLKKLNFNNVEGIISGKSFYEGKIDLVEAQKILN